MNPNLTEIAYILDRSDIGFMRKHCSNGVIFEEEVATIKAFLTRVRSISMTTAHSVIPLKTALHLPDPKPGEKPARKDGLNALFADFATRLAAYQNELGPNDYAIFNTLTNIAARPPENIHFQSTRATLEKRPGRRLKQPA